MTPKQKVLKLARAIGARVTIHQARPLDASVTAPAGMVFMDLHEFVVHDWADVFERMKDEPLGPCETPDCEFCEIVRDGGTVTDAILDPICDVLESCLLRGQGRLN